MIENTKLLIENPNVILGNLEQVIGIFSPVVQEVMDSDCVKTCPTVQREPRHNLHPGAFRTCLKSVRQSNSRTFCPRENDAI